MTSLSKVIASEAAGWVQQVVQLEAEIAQLRIELKQAQEDHCEAEADYNRVSEEKEELTTRVVSALNILADRTAEACTKAYDVLATKA